LAARLGVTVLNAPGTVDAGYRGEILVNLVNHDPTRTARLHRGDRIAQLVVQRVERARFRPVGQLPESVRGAGGHGSTGGFTPADRSAPPTGPDRRDDAGESVTIYGCGEVAE
jgi:dUTP pyrophosphatase